MTEIKNITVQPSTLLHVIDAEKGRYTETQISSTHSQAIDEKAVPYPRDSRGRMTVNPENMRLTEAGEIMTSNYPDLLRLGVTFDAFTQYNELPVTYTSWARMVDSSKMQEEYLKDAAIGRLPRVLEGQPYSHSTLDLNDGVIIKNYKAGATWDVTEEMMKFDQLGKVREQAELMGRAARLTEELDCMDVLTTTGNYVRNSTTNDNDVGANTQNLTFSPTGLITAFTCLQTMKDRKTGVKLGVNPNLLIVTPKLRFAAIQLLTSPNLMRIGYGTAGGAALDTYGGGTNNPFFNLVTDILVSPYFGSNYEWCLMEKTRAVTFQRVEPMQILRGAQDATSVDYMRNDVITFRVRDWYGVGMRDDRFAFFSNSSTAPTIN